MIFTSLPGSKIVLGLVAAGWLATALASKNSDIEAGIRAYEDGDSEAALLAYAAAEEALGERPEIHFNRGLALLAKGDPEAARKAFEHGSESEHEAVRASAEYELGNLDFDAEAWDAAIEHYIACLKINADHQSAKWNLELARLRKKEQEEEQEKDDENKDDENKDDENKDDENKDDENKDDENKDDENKDDENKDDENKDDENKDDENEDDENKDEQNQDEQNQDEQNQDEQNQDEQNQQPQPQPVERADLDKALEELDSQDNFFLGKPLGRSRPVEKDW